MTVCLLFPVQQNLEVPHTCKGGGVSNNRFITSNFSHSTQISTIDITKIKSYPLFQYIGLILIYTILSSLNHGILYTTRGFTTSLQYDSVMSADVMLSKQACVLKETLSSVTFTPQSIITFQPNNALKVQVFREDDIC